MFKLIVVTTFFILMHALCVAKPDNWSIALKGFTLKGHSDYTRIQIDLDFSKLSDEEKLRAGTGHFMLQLRNKGGLPITNGTSNYDLMPSNLPLIHDNTYFGQQMLKNYVTSIETAVDGTDYATPTFLPEYVKQAQDGLWKARGVAVYPLKGDEEKGHRDSGAKLDIDDTSEFNGNVFIGWLLGVNKLESYMRYTIESLDGTPILKKGAPGAPILFVSHATTQTPEDVSYAMLEDPQRPGSAPFSFKKMAQITDGGQYNEKGPIKTKMASNARYLSAEARANIAKIEEEGSKQAEAFERQREEMTKEFKEMEKQLLDSRRNVRETLKENENKLNLDLTMENNETPGLDENAEDVEEIKKRAEEAVKKTDTKKREEAGKQAEAKQAEAALAAKEEAEKNHAKQAEAETKAALLQAEKAAVAEADKKAAAEAEKEAAAQAEKDATSEAEKKASNAQTQTESELLQDISDEPPAVPEDL